MIERARMERGHVSQEVDKQKVVMAATSSHEVSAKDGIHSMMTRADAEHCSEQILRALITRKTSFSCFISVSDDGRELDLLQYSFHNIVHQVTQLHTRSVYSVYVHCTAMKLETEK